MKLVKRRAVIVNDVINLVPRSYFEIVFYNRLAVKDLDMRLWRNSSGEGRLGSHCVKFISRLDPDLPLFSIPY